MNKISILTPARRRPNNIRRMLQSIHDTISGENNIEVIFRIDDTDELLNNPEFKEEIYQKFINTRVYVNFIVGPETFPDLGVLWNECYQHCLGDYIQMGGDDLVYETKDWDVKIISQFKEYPDEIVLIWASDRQHENVLATHGFVSRKWIETLGWFTPPYNLTYYNDCFVHDIASGLGRLHFMCDVLIRHDWAGKYPNDPNFSRMDGYFKKGSDFFYGDEGRKIIADAVIELQKVMN